MGTEKVKGKCDGCGNDPRVLTRLESGQSVCRTCLRQIRPSVEKRKTPTRQGKTGAKKTAARDSSMSPTVSQRSASKLRRGAAPGSGIRHFYTKAAGVSYKNTDGTRRQDIIEQCCDGEELTLEHEKGNRYDPNAIALLRGDGDQIGYLGSELAEGVVEELARGFQYRVFISEVTGGDSARPTFGVNLAVVVGQPGVRNQDVQQYISAALGGKYSGGFGGIVSLVIFIVAVLAIFWLASSTAQSYSPSTT